MDDDYHQLLEDVKCGMLVSTYSQALKGSLDILSISDNLVLLDSRRIVLPLPAVKPVLKLLHSSMTKTTNLARGLYFWSGMTNDIKQMISLCPDCVRVLPSQPANPMVTPSPSTHFGYPMQHVGLDLFTYANKDYLICVDHWSGYPFYQQLCSLSSDDVIKVLTSWFRFFGWPSQFEAMEAHNFVESFPASVKATASRIRCLLRTTRRTMDWPKLV